MATTDVRRQRVIGETLSHPRIGVLVVAYQAASTLASVLERIPASAWARVDEVAVFDDASDDGTAVVAHAFAHSSRLDKLTVVRHPENLGYGGNQKAGFSHFHQRGFDVVVLLHGDGQYAPEVMERLIEPLLRGEADAVFGSRMMPGLRSALSGGMPLYKLVGNRILTSVENRALGMRLTEFHSGYRAYSMRALDQLDLSATTDDFHFDTQIIVKLHHAGFRIKEIPIPTYYGDEICRVNGLRYARDVFASVWRYRRTVAGAKQAPEFAEYFPHYPLKRAPGSSHDFALRRVGTGEYVLDLGCGEGDLAAELAGKGNQVVGVDVLRNPSRRDAMEQYVKADLSHGLSDAEGALAGLRFDRILLLDVLEHLPDPGRLLDDLMRLRLLTRGGTVIVSLPNVANLSVRLQLLGGRFSYADRGILDRTHLRFYTRKSARALLQRSGYEVLEQVDTVIPLELVVGALQRGPALRAANASLRALTRVAPGLLGYQTLLLTRPRNTSL